MFEGLDIWLISHSPRRIQLLKELGLTFQIGIAEVDELYPHSLSVEQVPIYLSRLKADNATCQLKDNTLVITADTIVAIGDKVLGKPQDAAEAREMLRSLSGQTHQVVTGVTIRSKRQTCSFAETTDVTFSPLSPNDIDYYVETFRPFDKAGAYGIQEWIGMVGVSGIRGCFYNVMGLPVARLVKEMRDFVVSDAVGFSLKL